MGRSRVDRRRWPASAGLDDHQPDEQHQPHGSDERQDLRSPRVELAPAPPARSRGGRPARVPRAPCAGPCSTATRPPTSTTSTTMNTTIEAMTHGCAPQVGPGRGPQAPDDQQQEADVHRPDRHPPVLRSASTTTGSRSARRRNAMNADAPWLIANSTRPTRWTTTNQGYSSAKVPLPMRALDAVEDTGSIGKIERPRPRYGHRERTASPTDAPRTDTWTATSSSRPSMAIRRHSST